MVYREKNHSTFIEISLLAVVVIWAINYPIVKYGLAGLNPFIFNSIRYIVASLVAVLPFLLRYKWERIAKEDIRSIARAGIVASVAHQVMFIVGMSMTTAGNAVILLSTSPLFTVILNARLQRERIKPAVWTGMLISLVGIILIIIGSGKKVEFGGNELLGDFICLGASALWALNNNLQRPILQRYNVAQFALIQFVIGAVGLSVIAMPWVLRTDLSSVHWTYYCRRFCNRHCLLYLVLRHQTNWSRTNGKLWKPCTGSRIYLFVLYIE
jgi:drug/metabolite transporter (DMT)-like permease